MKLVLLLIVLIAVTASGYRILSIQHVPTKSHYNLMAGIVRTLLEAGHEITMVSLFPEKKPVKNLRIIDMSALQNVADHVDVLNPDKVTFAEMMAVVSNLTTTILNTAEVREVLTKENFDAVISEWFFSDVNAGYAAALQIPWILLHGEMSPHMEHLIDTVRSIPIIPTKFNNVPIPMTLGQRLKNTMWYLLMTYGFLRDFSASEAEYKTKFGPIAEARGVSLPPYSEAIHNISVLLLNSHPSFTAARSLPPNVVEIGGYHIDENIPPLPEDLQKLLDSSKNGVVYFSMGSVIKSKKLPDKTKRDLVELFGELPYTVLWKFEAEMENLPKNLHVRAWMPQTSILSHPNVKVFITHGGALSNIESLRFGKPILAIPVFGDQPSNAEQSVLAGRALKVPFSPDMVGEVRVALKEMLSNDSYYKRAQYLSRLFLKRPLSPGKLIQNNVELAIESKGAYHLRSKTQLYKWYEIWMLDQVAVLLMTSYVAYRTVKKIASTVLEKFSKTKKAKRQ